MNPAPNLVLIGPMGAGKSSLGRSLATRLGLAFVDSDERLEQIAGASVQVIFEVEGEAAFRSRETQVLGELMQAEGQVVSTGGGAVLSAENRALLRQRGFVVYLQVDIERQLQRLARDHTRPLLAGGGRRQTLEALAAQRNPLYEEIADLVFEAGGAGLGSATNRLGAQVESSWRRGSAA